MTTPFGVAPAVGRGDDSTPLTHIDSKAGQIDLTGNTLYEQARVWHERMNEPGVLAACATSLPDCQIGMPTAKLTGWQSAKLAEFKTRRFELLKTRMDDGYPTLPAVALSSGDDVRKGSGMIDFRATPAEPPRIESASARAVAAFNSDGGRTNLAGSWQASEITPMRILTAMGEEGNESGRWLRGAGLFDKFNDTKAHQHISYPPDGSASAVITSADGYRLTIMCKTDGNVLQRVTNPSGEVLSYLRSSKVG